MRGSWENKKFYAANASKFTNAEMSASPLQRCRFFRAGRSVKNRRLQHGAAAIEFALLLPLLLLLLIGSIDMSLALYDKSVITNASREGARAGIVARNPQISEAEIRQVVQAYTQSTLLNLGAGNAAPTVSIEKGLLGTNPTLRVSVSYTFQGIGLGSLFSTLGQSWVLKSSTVMVYE
jgi:Flp pilus assembly protein TadG